MLPRGQRDNEVGVACQGSGQAQGRIAPMSPSTALRAGHPFYERVEPSKLSCGTPNDSSPAYVNAMLSVWRAGATCHELSLNVTRSRHRDSHAPRERAIQ